MYYRVDMAVCSPKSILFLILAVCIVFPVFFTETLVLAELEHDCTTENENCRTTTKEEEICHPCLQIEAALNFLKILKQADIVTSLTPYLTFPVKLTENNTGYNTFSLSPVELKVRFNT